MEAKEAFKVVIDTLEDVKRTDDELLSIANNLKIILFNLQIEAAKLHEPNAVNVIAEELQGSVNHIKDVVHALTSNRGNIVRALTDLNEYIG